LTGEIALVLSIIVAASALLAFDRFRVDVVAGGILLALMLSRLATVEEGFSGLSSPAIITVGSMFIISEGLYRTGVASVIGQHVLRLTGDDEVRLITILMVTAGVLSAFMNNVGATAMLLPAIISIARDTGLSPSRLCIPLAFSSLLGGLCTLVGTPANILVSDALRARGLAPFNMFDFTVVGLTLLVVGIGYMVLAGRHLLPNWPMDPRLRAGPSTRRQAMELYRLQERLTMLRVLPDSPLAGRTILESQLGHELGVNILSIIRDGRRGPAPATGEVLLSDDLLLVLAGPEQIARAQELKGLAVEDAPSYETRDIQSANIGIAEVILAPHTLLEGRTLENMRFRERFGLTVLAIWREGQPRRTALADLPLRFGDALLVQGPWENIELLAAEPDFLLLESAETRQRRDKMGWAVGILLVVVASQVSGLLPIALATFLGALLMIVAGCLSMEEAYIAVDWRVIFLIAGMLPLGLVLGRTGAARYLAGLMIRAVGAGGPYYILAGVVLLTALFTQVLPSAAAAVLVAPIALDTALAVGVNPRAFLLSVALAASCSFVTPVGHQSNILVMGPGNYRFADYVRVGLPLNLLVVVILLLITPLIWPLGG
jgi:di/tricarboxylate transporter